MTYFVSSGMQKSQSFLTMVTVDQIFAGLSHLLSPSQQHQSTEGKHSDCDIHCYKSFAVGAPNHNTAAATESKS